MSTAVGSLPELERARARLVSHPLYGELSTAERVRAFMGYHVFAVWDFFSLLKRLQREVSCVSVPWLPRGLGDHARFITEIVLSEECDEGLSGEHISHFELYLQAMREQGADSAPIQTLCARLADGESVEVALAAPEIPQGAREFVEHTLRVAIDGAPHEVAACFCHGRENLLPDVLTGVRDGLGDSLASSPVFAHYLERHITLDHDEHGPLALRLLDALCAGDASREADALRVGVEAINARSALWDAALIVIDGLPRSGPCVRSDPTHRLLARKR